MKIKSIEITELDCSGRRVATSRRVAHSSFTFNGCPIKAAYKLIRTPRKGAWLMTVKMTSGQWYFDKGGW
jgi:hypothetical protein